MLDITLVPHRGNFRLGFESCHRHGNSYCRESLELQEPVSVGGGKLLVECLSPAYSGRRVGWPCCLEPYSVFVVVFFFLLHMIFLLWIALTQVPGGSAGVGEAERSALCR